MEPRWSAVSLHQEYQKNKDKLTKGQVDQLKEWVDQQPHLPCHITELDLVMFLHACDYNLEMAKNTLDVNYTLRTKAVFFKRRDPTLEELKESMRVVELLWLDPLPGGEVVLMGRLADPKGRYVFNNTIKTTTMMMDVLSLEYGTTNGLVLIMDASEWTLSHILSVPLGPLRHFFQFIQEGTALKVKSLHFVNTKGSLIDKIMALIRPLLKASLKEVMFFHPEYKTLLDHGFTEKILPIEYGGTAGYFSDMADEKFGKLNTYREYFEKMEEVKVDESKRPSTGGRFFGWF